MLRILAGHANRTAYRRRRLPLRVPLASVFPISSFHSEPVRAPRRSRWWIGSAPPPSASPHGAAGTNIVSLPFRSRQFFVGILIPRLDRVGLHHARRVRHLHLFHNEPKKIPGDGRSGQPVPGPQRRPHQTSPPAQVSSRASARWRGGRASPSGTPSGRVPPPFAGRFRVPAQTPPGSIPSLCRSPESFVVCSSIFSHFYARRRRTLTPDAPVVPSTANARLTGTLVPFHRQMTTGCCRKDLSPIGGAGVRRGHTGNLI